MWTAHLQEGGIRVSLKPHGNWTNMMGEGHQDALAGNPILMAAPMS